MVEIKHSSFYPSSYFPIDNYIFLQRNYSLEEKQKKPSKKLKIDYFILISLYNLR